MGTVGVLVTIDALVVEGVVDWVVVKVAVDCIFSVEGASVDVVGDAITFFADIVKGDLAVSNLLPKLRFDILFLLMLL